MVGNDTIHTVTRKEHDCIGYMDVPKDVYWGIHTQRALGNFTVSRIADSTHPQLMRPMRPLNAPVPKPTTSSD